MSEKIKTRAHELNNEFHGWKRVKNIQGEYSESLAAFVFTKIAALEIENEDLKREIKLIREHITRPGR